MCNPVPGDRVGDGTLPMQRLDSERGAMMGGEVSGYQGGAI